MKIAIIAAAAALLPACAQELKLPANVEALADKAEESVVVTLDKPMLDLAARVLKNEDGEENVRSLISGLEGVYVRSFQFGVPGEYSAADVQSLRDQLRAPAWGRIVGVRSRRSDGDVDVYFKDAGNGRIGGLVVIDAEPRELNIVSVVGNIDPEKIVSLGGEFGIPRLRGSHLRRIDQ